MCRPACLPAERHRGFVLVRPANGHAPPSASSSRRPAYATSRRSTATGRTASPRPTTTPSAASSSSTDASSSPGRRAPARQALSRRPDLARHRRIGNRQALLEPLVDVADAPADASGGELHAQRETRRAQASGRWWPCTASRPKGCNPPPNG